jgi:hypothetical protein
MVIYVFELKCGKPIDKKLIFELGFPAFPPLRGEKKLN